MLLLFGLNLLTIRMSLVLCAMKGPWNVKCSLAGSQGPYAGQWQKDANGGGGGATGKFTTYVCCCPQNVARAAYLLFGLHLNLAPPGRPADPAANE